MAITTDGPDTEGNPTSWSSAVDQAAVGAEQALSHFDRAFTLHANSQEDGEQLGVREGAGSVLGHFLARAHPVRKVVDDHDVPVLYGKVHMNSIFKQWDKLLQWGA